MAKQRIGIIHPGEMGISIAVSAQNSGNQVYWASAGRGAQTRERAARHGLRDAGTLAELCATCAVLLCVCPPHAAEEVARQVLENGFAGLYLDANAISPRRVAGIGQMMAERGVAFVDGGIIGGPAWQPGATWLYLAGAQAERVAACFAAGPLATKVIGETIGRASALKMCYAAYSKGTTALLAAALAAAEQLGVRSELQQQWARDDPKFAEQAGEKVRRVTAKAWRFVGEMQEIAATLEAAGLPGGFHQAAADTYRRIASFKDAPATPALDDVLAALLDPGATIDQLWDYDQPAESERRFRELLPRLDPGTSAHLEALTQLARAQGLQRDFAAAHQTLDQVEGTLGAAHARAAIRYALERGRVLNSSGQPGQARPLFLAAWEQAQAAGADFYAIDAAHMLGIVEPPEQALEWNRRALALAERTADPRAKKWLGSAANNIGWAYHDQRRYAEALEAFQQALRFREQQGLAREIRVARWCVARALRSLGRTGEALALQQALQAEIEQAGERDGYVAEELAECLLALGRPAEARPWFAKAHAELSQDAWLAEGEPGRIARLKELGIG